MCLGKSFVIWSCTRHKSFSSSPNTSRLRRDVVREQHHVLQNVSHCALYCSLVVTKHPPDHGLLYSVVGHQSREHKILRPVGGARPVDFDLLQSERDVTLEEIENLYGTRAYASGTTHRVIR